MVEKETEPQGNQVPAVQQQPKLPASPVRAFLESPNIKKRFEEILGAKGNQFLASVLQVINGNDNLRTANPMTVYASAMIAATLDLPINQNLGFAWIVPYKGEAQFQMGWKGYVQLAMRTGQYSRLNVTEVFQNQFISYNELTEDLQANFAKQGEGPVVGYVGYFRLINGFEKTVYWSREKTISHAKKYSKNYNGKNSIWLSDPDSMGKKTVLKNMLSKWGIMSVEMNKAIQVDQAVVHDADTMTITFPDNPGNDEEETETSAERGSRIADETEGAMKGMTAAAKNKGGAANGS